jgi:hypothetical protein
MTSSTLALVNALKKYMSAGVGESTDFYKQAEAWDAANEAIAAIEAETVQEPVAQANAFYVKTNRIYLVATGQITNGMEQYTRHDTKPPMCDAETLYTVPGFCVPLSSDGAHVFIDGCGEIDLFPAPQQPAPALEALYEKSTAETDQLRGFARRVMQAWPEGDIEGFDLQDAAVEFGLLATKNPPPTESCGEGCTCAEYFNAEEFSSGGVLCFHRTELLTGRKS